ncbi:transcription elongation factor [Fulvivirga imtechensis AK7]|uniref:Transcription elongation factor n=1 Tax=Fulvivirga imtechensis AK7 TaxID=1237149 RepID=L8JPX5_9BACT|nr:GreA/GreB family elongation factor [Fulvivirga imtechensis]ELR70233.1 transcription elongation factor [Fulvivirga imtechensis AK7]
MNQQNIIVEKNEYDWLLGMLENRRYTDPLNQSCLEALHKELKSAVVKEEFDMPRYVVRINSMVDVLTPYGIKKNIQIVVPAERNMEQDKISILSPMGSALFGYKKGDEVRWLFPKGKGKIKILEVKNAPKRVFK